MPPQKKLNRTVKDYARYSGMAFQMIAVILLGVYLGYKTDQWLDLSFHLFLPLFTVLFLGLSVYLAIKDLIKK